MRGRMILCAVFTLEMSIKSEENKSKKKYSKNQKKIRKKVKYNENLLYFYNFKNRTKILL